MPDYTDSELDMNTKMAEMVSIAVGDPSKSYPREMRISIISNGFLIHVGCHKFSFNTKSEMLDAVALYYKDPSLAEKKYLKNKLEKFND